MNIDHLALFFGLFLSGTWYANIKFKEVHQRLDDVMRQFNCLRVYLYEIDPQFDEERALTEAFMSNDNGVFDGASLAEHINERKEKGLRTLNSPLCPDD